MAEDYFDLSGLTDDDWKDMENPTPIPAGWYRAKVVEVDADANTGNVFLHFQVQTGPFKGKKVKETLWNPENSDTQEKTDGAKKRRMLLASRLGLITAADKARRDPNFRVVWDNALGVEVWVKVEQRTYDKKDKTTGKPTGEKGTSNQLAFDGVFPINDERVPEDVRKGTAPAPGSTTTPTTQAAPSRPTQQASKPAPTPAPANPVNIADLV